MPSAFSRAVSSGAKDAYTSQTVHNGCNNSADT